jgi:hypothetical protein
VRDLRTAGPYPEAQIMQPAAGVLRLEAGPLGSRSQGDDLLDRPTHAVDLDPVLADVLRGLSVEPGSDQLRTQLEGLSVESEAHAH